MIQNILEGIRGKIKKIITHNEQLKKFNYKMESLLVSFETYSISEDKKNNKVSYKEKVVVQKKKKENIYNENLNNKKVENITKTDFTNIMKSDRTTKNDHTTKSDYTKVDYTAKTDFTKVDYTTKSDYTKVDQKKVDNFIIPDLQKVSKILQKEQNIKKSKVEEITPPDMSHTIIDTSLLFDNKNELLNRALADENLEKSNKGHLIKIIDLLYQNKQGVLWEDIIQKSGVPRYKCIEILNCLVKTDPPIMIKKRDKGFTCYINIQN